jgi:hypothetical protein
LNILLLASHAVAEYDDLRMLTDLGYTVFCPGGYANPGQPTVDTRPPLAAPYYEDLARLCDVQRERHAGESVDWAVDWAKADLHPNLVDWADTIIVHHYVDRWIAAQMTKLRGKRVIWRTCGQSSPQLELYMAPFREAGMQIVRYSPAEKKAFSAIRTYAGDDAIIRFGKYPEDYGPWIGDQRVVGNLTQNFVKRGESTNLTAWQELTDGLPTCPAGEGSEELGGSGRLSYPDILVYWKHLRVHLYTGTQPASYTLSLIEAMLSGTPTVSISADRTWLPPLFEAETILGQDPTWDDARRVEELRHILDDDDYALEVSLRQRQLALDLFHVKHVGQQWVDFLGGPS